MGAIGLGLSSLIEVSPPIMAALGRQTNWQEFRNVMIKHFGQKRVTIQMQVLLLRYSNFCTLPLSKGTNTFMLLPIFFPANFNFVAFAFSSNAIAWFCRCYSFSSQVIGEKPDRERSSFSDPRPLCGWALQRDVDLRVSKVHRGRGIHCQDPFLIRPRKVGDG